MRPYRRKYRSGLEDKVVAGALEIGLPFVYEGITLPFEKPAKYKPDLLLGNGIVVEIKGYFESSDRAKHKLIHAKYPEIDIRFLFSKPSNLIGKKSRTTYADWCRQNGIPYEACDTRKPTLPHRWITEPVNLASIEAILGCPEIRLTEEARELLEGARRERH